MLIGTAMMPVPDHPRVRHLGFVSDADKFDAIAGATALVLLPGALVPGPSA